MSLSSQDFHAWIQHLSQYTSKVPGVEVQGIGVGKSRTESVGSLRIRLGRHHVDWRLLQEGTIELDEAKASSEMAERDRVLRRQLFAVDPYWCLPPERILPWVPYLREDPRWDDLDRIFYFSRNVEGVASGFQRMLGSRYINFGYTTVVAMEKDLKGHFRYEMTSTQTGHLDKMMSKATRRGLAFGAVSGAAPGLRFYRGVLTLTDRSLRCIGTLNLCG